MKKTVIACAISTLLLGGCANGQFGASAFLSANNVKSSISGEMNETGRVIQARINQGGIEYLADHSHVSMPQIERSKYERFSIVAQDESAENFFNALVADTRYSIIVPRDIKQRITLNLKNVTIQDVLRAVEDSFGIEYTIDGNRIVIYSGQPQTRIFHVNYLSGSRSGRTFTHVTSGSVVDSSKTTGTITPGAAGSAAIASNDNTRITTDNATDFWADMEKTMKLIVGDEKDGRFVAVTQSSGTVTVRAPANVMRKVEEYIQKTQLSVDRQVIIEAKIIEVSLNDRYQSGINWGAFKNSVLHGTSVGMVQPGATMTPLGGGAMNNGVLSAVAGQTLAGAAGAAGSMFGIAFQASRFSALMDFLETQGSVHVLSSPRISTLNKQKALLKQGSEDFFVTDMTPTSTTGAVGTTTTSMPSVKLQPFFSGIALDVTPNIDENGDVVLHVRPSVSQVTTSNKTISIAGLSSTLPLASSTTSETDSMIRVSDGQIVAIGGLMRQSANNSGSGLPGLTKLLFGQKDVSSSKSEFVILLKANVVKSDKDWERDVSGTQSRIQKMSEQQQ